MPSPGERLHVPVDGIVLDAVVVSPPRPRGLVIMAAAAAGAAGDPIAERRVLDACGFSAVVVDLLAPAERENPRCFLDVFLLARRLRALTDAVAKRDDTRALAVGYLGRGTAGAGALVASLDEPRVRAVVSVEGRPDLAEGVLDQVRVPTLLTTDQRDARGAGMLASLRCPKAAAGVAPDVPAEWFVRHLGDRRRLVARSEVGLVAASQPRVASVPVVAA